MPSRATTSPRCREPRRSPSTRSLPPPRRPCPDLSTERCIPSASSLSPKPGSQPATSTGTSSATAPPSAPASLTVVPDGSGDLVATWSAPATAGSDPLTGYSLTYQAETRAAKGVWSLTGTPTTLPFSPTTTTAGHGTRGRGLLYVLALGDVVGRNRTASQTPNPVTPTVDTGSNTVVLSQATMDALATDTSGLLSWPAPPLSGNFARLRTSPCRSPVGCCPRRPSRHRLECDRGRLGRLHDRHYICQPLAGLHEPELRYLGRPPCHSRSGLHRLVPGCGL